MRQKGGKAPRPDDTIAEPLIRFSCPAILSLIARLRAPRFGCQQIGSERARRAAEALFTPKPLLTEQSVPESLSAADHPVRKPRILAISPATSSDREAVETLISLKRQTVRGIPVSQFERIRTWVKYGMTVPQVAQFYGVAVEEIKRILRKV
jgi:hypothetical protein